MNHKHCNHIETDICKLATFTDLQQQQIIAAVTENYVTGFLLVLPIEVPDEKPTVENESQCFVMDFLLVLPIEVPEEKPTV